MTTDEGSPGTDTQVAAVVAAEMETLSRACRLEADRLGSFLAEDFHEFGRSGGEMTKPGTAERVAAWTGPHCGGRHPREGG